MLYRKILIITCFVVNFIMCLTFLDQPEFLNNGDVRSMGIGNSYFITGTSGMSSGINPAKLSHLDNSFEFKTSSVRPFLSFRRVTNKVYANISFEFPNMNMEKLLNESSYGIMKHSYFLPRFYYRNNYASGRKLDISYRTNYRLPSLNQLFPISNNLNQLNVYKGNVDLKPQYDHTLRLTWTVFDQFSFTSFYFSTHYIYKCRTRICRTHTGTPRRASTLLRIPCLNFFWLFCNQYFL